MTYPAELQFKRDRALTPGDRRVYDYLSTVLDFVEVRSVKIQMHARAMGLKRETLMRSIDCLVRIGYLIDQPRGQRNVRRLTLAWSVNPSKTT